MYYIILILLYSLHYINLIVNQFNNEENEFYIYNNNTFYNEKNVFQKSV